MAKIQEKIIAVKLSRLVRDREGSEEIVDAAFAATLETLVSEIVGDSSVIVEVIDELP